MARYKVPQDVEADDKLLGPFSFRQFLYLLAAGILIALAVGLFQIFPLLAIIPLPPVLLFVVLALPLKKDQPMETYLAAVASYYLKPHNRKWMPGQKEATIEITAPKIVDDHRTRDISSEEATHRLSFLADIVDTGGYAIKGVGVNHPNTELAIEADQTQDIFEAKNFDNIENTLAQDETARHAEVIEEMKKEIAKVENLGTDHEIVKGFKSDLTPTSRVKPNFNSSVVVNPTVTNESPVEKSSSPKVETREKAETKQPNPSIIELANNDEYSVATIAKEANRIKEREKGEVFISLH